MSDCFLDLLNLRMCPHDSDVIYHFDFHHFVAVVCLSLQNETNLNCQFLNESSFDSFSHSMKGYPVPSQAYCATNGLDVFWSN